MPESDPALSEQEKLALVREGYDRIAAPYTRLASEIDDSHPRKAQVRRLLGRLASGSCVLDAGCGGGVPVAAAVVEAGHAVVGVDISPRQIDLARTNVPSGDFRVGNVVDQDFEPASFDAVVMLYAITHVPSERWSALFAAFSRWVRSGGWVLLNVPQHADRGWFEEDFLELGGTSWTNSLDPSETIVLIEGAGLGVAETAVVPDDEPDSPGWLWILAQRP